MRHETIPRGCREGDTQYLVCYAERGSTVLDSLLMHMHTSVQRLLAVHAAKANDVTGSSCDVVSIERSLEQEE